MEETLDRLEHEGRPIMEDVAYRRVKVCQRRAPVASSVAERGRAGDLRWHEGLRN